MLALTVAADAMYVTAKTTPGRHCAHADDVARTREAGRLCCGRARTRRLRRRGWRWRRHYPRRRRGGSHAGLLSSGGRERLAYGPHEGGPGWRGGRPGRAAVFPRPAETGETDQSELPRYSP